MHLSHIARSVGESATLRLNATAAALRQQGEPVIHLGGGEPLGQAPPEAIARAARLLQTGQIRYGPADGLPAMKEAVIEYTQRFYGQTVEPHNVIASSGAKQAIMVCLQAILDPGDEVVFPAPYWVSYPEMVRLAGGIAVPVVPADPGFQPTLDEIRQKLSGRTRAVIINTPSNPAGIQYREEFVADLVRLCEQRGLYLIVDDIYHRLVFDGRAPLRFFEYLSGSLDDSRFVLANSVSKTYAMTGFRLGWAVAGRELVRAMARIQGHQTSGPSVLLQQAAIGALTGDQSGVDRLRSQLQANRDLLCEALALIPGVRFRQPEGAFYSFPDFRAYEPSSVALAQLLLERVRVVTVPGAEFGMDGFLRISFCGPAEEIREGISRIRQALEGIGLRPAPRKS